MKNTGTGPGAITPDGSPVEFYNLLKPGEDPDLVAGVTPPGGSVLELGAGVGRVTHALVARGFQVVAVDESAEMLGHVRGAETVLARVQDLRLGRGFDTVTLASQLVNAVEGATRSAFLATCAAHVRPGGAVLIQWMPAERHDAWRPGMGRIDGDLTVTLAEVEQVSPGVFEATMRYTHGDRVWTQSFASRRLTDDDLRADLAAEGLRLERFLTEDRTWLLARPFTT
ncbi:MAG: class I SAM-dependent methyltransferase [Nonomuraea sp.]|nr:class I SAM-dependent methyltransferase [Nonomuraea sp.]NUP65772.1 class I SAM-dependent methyltransferase [Nonomuraea sp.]NUP83560.1 class I SAM-dependent methyltransferase [Nonomuraea sp.]NUT42051.1 class I SAM-dependent methyltransferase [Thermoactinospora sp.]